MDWLTDIGGLWGAVFALCTAFVSITQLQGANMLLMTELFGKPAPASLGQARNRRSSNPLALQRSTSFRNKGPGDKSSDNFDV